MAAITSAVVVAGTAAYSAHQQNKRAKEAANQQQAGVAAAQQYSKEAAEEASGMLDPIVASGNAAGQAIAPTLTQYRDVGKQGIASLSGLEGEYDAQKGALNVNEFLDPSIAFAQQQGQQAIERSAAARGGLLSGAALKDLTQFSTGLASQNWNNAVAQAAANRQQQLGILGQQQNIANTQIGLGDTALTAGLNEVATGRNALGQQANITAMQGTNAGNLAMTSGNIAARGTAAQTDVLGSALQAGIGAYFSDERMKYEIDDVTDEEIDAFLSEIDPKSYKYTDSAKRKGAPSGRKTGVMAQDVEKSKVGKRMVKQDVEGSKMIDVPMAVSTLLATVAVQNKRIKKLEGAK